MAKQRGKQKKHNNNDGMQHVTESDTSTTSNADKNVQNEEVDQWVGVLKLTTTATSSRTGDEGTEPDDASRARWQDVLDWEEAFANTHCVHNGMELVAKLMMYYHNLPNRQGSRNLTRALDIVEQIIVYEEGLPCPTDDVKARSYYLHGRMCRLKYLDTEDEAWIQKAVESSRKTVSCTDEKCFDDLKNYRFEKSLRLDSLRMMLEILFLKTFTQGQYNSDIWMELYETAHLAVESTVACDSQDHMTGEQLVWERKMAQRRVQLMVPLPSGTLYWDRDGWDECVKDALAWPGSQGACPKCGIDAEKWEPNDDMVWQVTHMMARRFVCGYDEDAKSALLEHVRKYQNPDWSEEVCFYHIAKEFENHLTDEDNNCPFVIHEATLKMNKALWGAFLNLNEPEDHLTFPDLYAFNRNYLAIQSLVAIQKRIHWRTQLAKDAWFYDDLAWESCSKSTVYQQWNQAEDQYSMAYVEATGELRNLTEEEKQRAAEKRDDTVMPDRHNSYSYVVQTSIIDYTSVIHIWMTPGMGWTTPRLRFLEVEGQQLPSMDTWISERTPDGRFVLGGPIEGRDDDVLKFLSEYNEKLGAGAVNFPGLARRLVPMMADQAQ